MARQLIWSPRAADSLEETCNFISRDSEKYACLFAHRVVCAVERLTDLPEIGRVVPEFNDTRIRELILGKYRVVYRVKNDAVEITLVVHGARLLKM